MCCHWRCRQQIVRRRMHLKVLVRMRKSVVRYQRGNVRELGRLRFQEFFACRNIEEQITNGNRGPRRYSRLFNFEQLASSNLNSTAGRVICLPGFKAEPRQRRSRAVPLREIPEYRCSADRRHRESSRWHGARRRAWHRHGPCRSRCR